MRELRDYVPEDVRTQGRWCIAGGYAACPALAGDIDIWILGVEPGHLEQERARALLHLQNLDTRTTESNDARTAMGRDNYEGIDIEIRKVAYVNAGPKHIHVMVTNAESPNALLSSFDISTHAVALLPNGFIVTGNGFTTPHERPVAVRENGKTPARMEKIRARFGRDPKTGDRHEEIPF